MSTDELLREYYDVLKTRQCTNRFILDITRELCACDDISEKDLADIAEAHDEADLALNADEWMVGDCACIIHRREREV